MPDISKHYFSYVRVSTARQGQTGTSLSEQQEAIRRYAERYGLTIIKEFEEQETAAKRGRPVFAEMLKGLKAKRAAGVIIHKIDRSARNLKDWADLGELIDYGVEVHFANESLDLQSRGGRLSADIQAVVAADFIRNLREETKKGLYGRIKQGLYPMPARIGYLDQGKGLPKIIDPAQAPIVKDAFGLYATGKWGLNALVEEMFARGLRNKQGGRVTRNGIATLLRNPFYAGLIHLKSTGEKFPGRHEPLIPHSLFDRVQAILDGRSVERHHRHSFLFRKHLICGFCRKTLIAELQKGYTYYRCQTRLCPQKTVREEVVEGSFTGTLRLMQFNDSDMNYFYNYFERSERSAHEQIEALVTSLRLEREQINDRLSRLTDAYLDGAVDKEIYVEKKNELLSREQFVKEKLSKAEEDENFVVKRVQEFLEQANAAYLSYKEGLFEDKRDLVKTVTSNFIISHKIVSIKLYYPFQLVVDRQKTIAGSPHRIVPRTLSLLLSQLQKYFQNNNLPELNELPGQIVRENKDLRLAA